jgi:hypothetical protein
MNKTIGKIFVCMNGYPKQYYGLTLLQVTLTTQREKIYPSDMLKR